MWDTDPRLFVTAKNETRQILEEGTEVNNHIVLTEGEYSKGSALFSAYHEKRSSKHRHWVKTWENVSTITGNRRFLVLEASPR